MIIKSVKELMVDLYQYQFIQTIWNAENEVNRKNGWRLKSGAWSPWFFNMRPVGCAPELYRNIIMMMYALIKDKGIDTLIGVDMAGITFVGALANEYAHSPGGLIKIGYTRPLSPKPRTPAHAAEILANENEEAKAQGMDYGQKQYVEARFTDGDRVAIYDDMSTNLGSKLIARLLTYHAADLQNARIMCDDVFYFLNRGANNKQAGIDFKNDTDERLLPAKLNVQYAIEFDDELPVLEDPMCADEYRLIQTYQENPKNFQDEAGIKAALKLAA